MPTLSEAGIRDVVIEGWSGVAAPAGTPAAIVTRVQQDIVRHLLAAEMRDVLAKQGTEPVGSTPEAFAAFIRAEAEKWGPEVVQRAGLANTQ